MALKIRLQRFGAPHHPEYRVVVTESTRSRDGKFVENLGHYKVSPRGKDVEMNVNLDRLNYWLGVGAQPTDTVRSIIKKTKAAAKSE